MCIRDRSNPNLSKIFSVEKRKLDLYETGCFGDAGKADWARLPALEKVDLEGTKVTGSEEDLKAAGCAAGVCRTATKTPRP